MRNRGQWVGTRNAGPWLTALLLATGSVGWARADGVPCIIPEAVGSIDTIRAMDLAFSGTTAYVADWIGLKIIDVSDPRVPVLMSTYDLLPPFTLGVFVAGSMAYVTNSDLGLLIFDVTDPLEPELLGSYDAPGWTESVVVEGSVAYVADGRSGLAIIDISEPTKPVLLGSYDTPDWAYSVTVAGTIAYVADGSSGLQIVEVSDPASPVLLGSIDLPSSVKDVAVVGTVAYVAQLGSGLGIIDVSDPAAPVMIGSFETYFAVSVTVDGSVVFIANDNRGLWDLPSFQIIDVRDPASPFLLGSYYTVRPGRGVVVEDSIAYLANDSWGLLVLDVSGDCSVCLADLNVDSLVNFFDLQIFLNWYVSLDPRADFFADGIVSYKDVYEFLDIFDAGCP
jgi:hypothetical protein